MAAGAERLTTLWILIIYINKRDLKARLCVGCLSSWRKCQFVGGAHVELKTTRTLQNAAIQRNLWREKPSQGSFVFCAVVWMEFVLLTNIWKQKVPFFFFLQSCFFILGFNLFNLDPPEGSFQPHSDHK